MNTMNIIIDCNFFAEKKKGSLKRKINEWRKERGKYGTQVREISAKEKMKRKKRRKGRKEGEMTDSFVLFMYIEDWHLSQAL